jgi:hypothetical protein
MTRRHLWQAISAPGVAAHQVGDVGAAQRLAASGSLRDGYFQCERVVERAGSPGGEVQPQFRAAPQDVLGGFRPFLSRQVFHLALVQIASEA